MIQIATELSRIIMNTKTQSRASRPRDDGNDRDKDARKINGERNASQSRETRIDTIECILPNQRGMSRKRPRVQEPETDHDELFPRR